MNEDRVEYLVICTSHYDGGGWLNATTVPADDHRDAARRRVERIEETVPDVLEFVVVDTRSPLPFARRVRVTRVPSPTFRAEVI